MKIIWEAYREKKMFELYPRLMKTDSLEWGLVMDLFYKPLGESNVPSGPGIKLQFKYQDSRPWGFY